MNKILFIIGFTLYILLILCSCRSIKNLTKTIDKSLEKKDLTVSVDSVGVKTDTSKFNTEIVVEYDSCLGIAYPFNMVTDVVTEPASVRTTQKIKRIIIKTKQDFHVKDSSVVRSSQIDNSKTKTVKTDIVKSKKTTSYWWLFLLIIPALFLLYQKYKSKLSWILK